MTNQQYLTMLPLQWNISLPIRTIQYYLPVITRPTGSLIKRCSLSAIVRPFESQSHTENSDLLETSFLSWITGKAIFTARCTLVQSAVLRSHVVCLSVRPSVALVDC